MATTYTLIAIAAIIAAFLLSGRRQPRQTAEQAPRTVRGDDLAVWPFEQMPFMTDSEVRFFALLQEAMPEHFIFAQVQLSRLIQASDPQDAAFWFNRICRMSAD